MNRKFELLIVPQNNELVSDGGKNGNVFAICDRKHFFNSTPAPSRTETAGPSGTTE
jgi:hypothetical protein